MDAKASAGGPVEVGRWLAVAAAMAASALCACQPEAPADWEVDSIIPTGVRIRWTDGISGTASVRYGPTDGHWELETPLQATSRGDHDVTVLGLPAGDVHQLLTLMTSPSGDVIAGPPMEVSIPDAPVAHLEATGSLAGTGYVLTHTLALGIEDVVVIVDGEGSVVWYSEPSHRGDSVLSASVDESDGSVWYAAHSTTEIGIGEVHHIALDGSYEEHHQVERLHSGVVPLAEGGFGYIKKLDAPWLDGLLLWDEIWEVLPDGEDRRVFSVRDHFEPEVLCGHQVVLVPGDPPIYDWTHANSLVLSEDGSAYYLMLRHFDAILKVDRESGALEWVLGGPYGELAFDDPGDAFQHAHMSQVTDGGFVVFDNGNHRSPRESRVMRYVVDEESRTVHTAWRHHSADPNFNSMLGDAKQLDNGHYLISWTESGLIEEVSEDGEVLWSARTPMGVATGRVSYVDSLYPPLP